MKNLLKISCVLAIALFVSMSVKAANPLTDGAVGAITVNVPAHLDLIVTDATVALIYNEYTSASSNLTGDTKIQIASNVNWKFSVKADAANFEAGSNNFPVGKVALTGVVSGPLSTTAIDLLGTGNMAEALITYTLSGLTNQFAGDYQVGITYALVQQ